MFRSSLTGGVGVLEDRDRYGADSCWRRILFCVGHELSAQAKVELAKLVVSGVVSPHGCKYLPYGTKVLFHGPLPDGYTAVCQKAGAQAIGEYIEERDGIPNALEVVCYFHPFVVLAPLDPGGGMFLEDGGREAMQQRFLCSMEIGRRLHPDGRVSIHQRFFCDKVSAKCYKNILSVRSVNLEAAPAILLSAPVILWEKE